MIIKTRDRTPPPLQGGRQWKATFANINWYLLNTFLNAGRGQVSHSSFRFMMGRVKKLKVLRPHKIRPCVRVHRSRKLGSKKNVPQMGKGKTYTPKTWFRDHSGKTENLQRDLPRFNAREEITAKKTAILPFNASLWEAKEIKSCGGSTKKNSASSCPPLTRFVRL